MYDGPVQCRLITVAVVALCAGGCRKAKPKTDDHVALESLGYVSSSPISEAEASFEGVTLLEPGAASPGLTVICQLVNDYCEVIDLSGKVVHKIRPSLPPTGPRESRTSYSVTPYDANDLIFLGGTPTSGTLYRVDWNGKIVWAAGNDDLMFHHDFAIADGGDIIALYGEERSIEHGGTKLPVRDNGLARIRPDGTFTKLVSFYDVLGERVPASDWDKLAKAYAAGKLTNSNGPKNAKLLVGMNETDLFHANSVRIAPADAAKWKKGDYIVAFRNLGGNGGVFALDPQTFAVRWSFTEGVENPHCPELVPGGHLLLFDNGPQRMWSRVIEIDPATEKIVREYKSSSPLFFSRAMSGVQLLPNGNWLITEGESGHVFELTPQDKIVWEFWNEPLRHANGPGHMRGSIYRAHRFALAEAVPSTALRAALDDARAHPITTAVRRPHVPRAARAWPTGDGGSPSFTFMFDDNGQAITYRVIATDLPAGQYHAVVGTDSCNAPGTIADLGALRPNGTMKANSGTVQVFPPATGLAELIGHPVIVRRTPSDELVACAPITPGQ